MGKHRVSGQNYRKVQRIPDTLRSDVGACCIFLIDVTGGIVCRSGEQTTLPIDEINALLGSSISALTQAGEILHDGQRKFHLIYQGNRYILFGINVGEDLLLTLLVPRMQFSSPIGAVMHYSQQAADDLSQFLTDANPTDISGQLPDDFQSAIAENLDDLF